MTAAPGDPIVSKTKYSGFYETDLAPILVAHGRDTVICCGLTTECCVDATAEDALPPGLSRAGRQRRLGAPMAELHQAALRNLELNAAILATTAEVVAAWETVHGR